MKLECKRDRTKEKSILKTNTAADFLKMLNRNNVQHFTYDTDTRKLTFTHNCREKEIDLSITSGVYPAVDIDDVCLIVNRNNAIDTFIRVQRTLSDFGTRRIVPNSGGVISTIPLEVELTFEKWILNKAGFSHKSHAELHMQHESRAKVQIQKQIDELTKKLESYV